MSQNVTKIKILNQIENILTHWWVAQVGSNEEKLEVENIVGLSREVILISVNDGTAQLYCRSKGQYHVV